MSSLTAWSSFYVIMGSSAGALTGLTFVVISLTTEIRIGNPSWGVAAFTTPTVFHFGAVLFVCALLSAPWQALWQPAVQLGLAGLVGMAYAIIVVRRLRRRENYDPVAEDWLWYGIVPVVAYALLVITAFLLPSNSALALFGIGAVLVLLLFTGIHNAWDVVTYLAIENIQSRHESGESKETGESTGVKEQR